MQTNQGVALRTVICPLVLDPSVHDISDKFGKDNKGAILLTCCLTTIRLGK